MVEHALRNTHLAVVGLLVALLVLVVYFLTLQAGKAALWCYVRHFGHTWKMWDHGDGRHCIHCGQVDIYR